MVYRKSATRTKSKGDKGSPCLTPLLQVKLFPGIPLSSTAEEADPKIFLTQLIQVSEKPLNFIISSMKGCSILSKAFSKSNLRITIFFLEWW